MFLPKSDKEFASWMALRPLRSGVTESSIAWQAHMGGFAIGLFFFPWLDRSQEAA